MEIWDIFRVRVGVRLETRVGKFLVQVYFDSDLSTFGSDGMEDALFYDDVDEPNVDWNQRNQQDVLDLDFQESNIVNIARRQLIPGKEKYF